MDIRTFCSSFDIRIFESFVSLSIRDSTLAALWLAFKGRKTDGRTGSLSVPRSFQVNPPQRVSSSLPSGRSSDHLNGPHEEFAVKLFSKMIGGMAQFLVQVRFITTSLSVGNFT